MQFVALIIAILVMGIILSYIDRHSIRGKQLLIFFYLAIAGLSLLRGFMFGALLFGIFAFWHWTALQRLKEGRGTGAQP
ncbi:MAG: hypothetical protein R3264_20885, partial [Anaerolineae bacterium]|nr:hypothetical protein [Anaerolineae bacterium]